MDAIGKAAPQRNVTRAFMDAFTLVHQAFRTSPAEIEEAKAAARDSFAAAEAGYALTAAMIRAGWKPLEEHASAFIARCDDYAILSQLYPQTPKPIFQNPDIQEAA